MMYFLRVLGPGIEQAFNAEGKSPACEDQAHIGAGCVGDGVIQGIKNKAVDAVYRQRPCQPRILKSAYAIR
jgi:hypothetical protein